MGHSFVRVTVLMSFMAFTAEAAPPIAFGPLPQSTDPKIRVIYDFRECPKCGARMLTVEGCPTCEAAERQRQWEQERAQEQQLKSGGKKTFAVLLMVCVVLGAALFAVDRLQRRPQARLRAAKEALARKDFFLARDRLRDLVDRCPGNEVATEASQLLVQHFPEPDTPSATRRRKGE